MTGFKSAPATGGVESNGSKRHAFCAALAVGGLLSMGGTAFAQGPISQMTVTAPSGYATGSGIGVGRTEDVTLSAPVRYGDLDLRTSWGLQQLHWRVADTAQSLCTRLDVFHSVGGPDRVTCIRLATQQALHQVLGAAPGA